MRVKGWKVKRILKKIIKVKYIIQNQIEKVMCSFSKPCLIMCCDGGISSQIYQYMWGQALIDKGYKVKYDLTFFEDNAKDMYGIFDRSYALDKLCNTYRMEIAPRWQINYYKREHLNMLNQPPNFYLMNLDYKWEMPLYLGNYYTCEPDNYIPYFKKYIKLKRPEEILDKNNLEDFYKIRNSESVGVHIRRGDMAKETSQWTSPSVDYFLNAIQSPEFIGKHFFFFSDEMDWVIENIIPRIKENIKYTLMEKNSNQNGHMDLYLLSACKHQIASQGSFGVVAFVLNDNPYKILMFPSGSRNTIQERLAGENVVYWSLEGKRILE